MKRNRALLLALACSVLLASAAHAQINNPANGHYYLYVNRSTSTLDWLSAKCAAESRSYNQVYGHLVTITSESENQFLIDNLPDWPSVTSYWTGGYYANAGNGAWHWITGEPWSYTNWYPEEPNGNGSEDGLEWRAYPGAYGMWNDFSQSEGEPGYIVEFDTVPEPASILALSVWGPLVLWRFGRRR